DRTGRDERTEARYRERADAGEPSKRAADDDSSRSASRRTLRRLGAFLVCEVLRADVFREQHRDVSVAETAGAQRLDRAVHGAVRRIDSEHCGVLSSHRPLQFSLLTSYL